MTLHGEVVTGRELPAGGLAAGLLEDGAAEGDDEARLFGQGDELRRRHQSALGVLPAHEGLEARDPAVVHAHDGLVVHAELPAVDGAPQVVLELQELRARACMEGSNTWWRALPRALAWYIAVSASRRRSSARR